MVLSLIGSLTVISNMIEHKLQKCRPDDPHRCQGSDGHGQCQNLAMCGEDDIWSKFCPKHGGNKQIQSVEARKLHDYRLQQWQERVDEFAASETCRSLRGEIGILRLTLEQTLDLCKNQNDLMMYAHRIQDIVMKIDKLVNSVNKIEMRSGNLLDKSGALILAGQVVEIINAEINDPAAIDRISKQLIDLVAQLAGKEIED